MAASLEEHATRVSWWHRRMTYYARIVKGTRIAGVEDVN
jgi:hypothetical protein